MDANGPATPDELALWLEGRARAVALEPPWIGTVPACRVPAGGWLTHMAREPSSMPLMDVLSLMALGEDAKDEELGWDGLRLMREAGLRAMAEHKSIVASLDICGSLSARGLSCVARAAGLKAGEWLCLAVDAGPFWMLIGSGLVEGPRALGKPGRLPWSAASGRWDPAGLRAASRTFVALTLCEAIGRGLDQRGDWLLSRAAALRRMEWARREAGEIAKSAPAPPDEPRDVPARPSSL